ncbi:MULTISPECIES: DUF6660 family protein [Sphingobacterium]|uniref:DUF6660 family protein n=1 Tax=Sphingobacterium TaxID=28453 RepID=UPI0035CCFBB4
MKSLAVILVIVLTALFVLPCTDGENNCLTSSNSQTAQMDHSHGQDSDDACSPFCLCSCCGISMNSFQFTNGGFYTLIPIPIAKKTVIRDVFFTSNYLGSIWQPPQSNV